MLQVLFLMEAVESVVHRYLSVQKMKAYKEGSDVCTAIVQRMESLLFYRESISHAEHPTQVRVV